MAKSKSEVEIEGRQAGGQHRAGNDVGNEPAAPPRAPSVPRPAAPPPRLAPRAVRAHRLVACARP